MASLSHTGPSGTAKWQTVSIGAEASQPLSVLLLPDASNELLASENKTPVHYILLESPLVSRGRAGTPEFSLTLLLSRRPTANDEKIPFLVQQGILSLSLSLAVPPEIRSHLHLGAEVEYRPLFAREVVFKLFTMKDGKERVLASAIGSAANLKASFALTLPRMEALEIMSALDRVESLIKLRTTVSFRAIYPDRTVRLTGSWLRIFDFLRAETRVNESFSQTDLRQRFDQLVSLGIVSISIFSSATGEVFDPVKDGALLFDIFVQLSGVILEPQANQSDPTDPEKRFRLRSKPQATSDLDYSQKVAGLSYRSIELEAGLEEVIGGVLVGQDRTRFIHLVSPSTGELGFGPVPRHIRTGRTETWRELNRRAPTMIHFIIEDKDSIQSAALALKPTSLIPTPLTLVKSNLVELASSNSLAKLWLVNDILINHPPKREHSLPLVDDPNSLLWRDYVNPANYWYCPSFKIVQPAQNALPASSPFVFSFQRSGATLSGASALEGHVRFSLRKTTSPEIQIALNSHGNPNARPVSVTGLSVELSLPFLDVSDNTLKRHLFVCQVDSSGETITASVKLLNDWVRLCYGILADPDFQGAESAKLIVSYTFEAYIPFGKRDIASLIGGKVALLPIVRSSADAQLLAGKIHFDATNVTYHHPLGEFRLKREVHEDRLISLSKPTTAKPHHRAGSAAAIPSPAIIARPQLAQMEHIKDLLSQTEYTIQTALRQEKLDLVYPCTELGGLYLENTERGIEAIGCREAFKLGHMAYHLYEEIRELNSPEYRAYRSLQQPGRFLILPSHYRITRYAPTMGDKRYRPAIAVYSSLDAAIPSNNRVFFQATLQPDLTPLVRRQLRDKLTAYAPDPILEYPTEIVAETEYAWTVDQAVNLDLAVVRAPDSFQVSLSTDLAGALLAQTLLQKSGIFGVARFNLPDGSIFESALVLELGHITGPWAEGPIEAVWESLAVRLTNMIEQPVEVGDLLFYDASGATKSVPVEISLSPGATHRVLSQFPAAEVYADYTLAPGSSATLEEIRSYVEDVHTNIIFVDLVNHVNHMLAHLQVRARIKNVENTYEVPMSGNPPQGVLDLILPLTTFLRNRTLQLQVIKTFQSGEVTTSSWTDWNLELYGNIISLSWDLIN